MFGQDVQTTKREKIMIIGGAERFINNKYNLDLYRNASFIFNPDQEPIIQLKSFSGKDDPPFHPGRVINIIESSFGVFSILICADFLEESLLNRIREEVDFLAVISFNKDTNEFMTRAYSWCYSNNCYIIITNILEYGGFSIHAPYRKGERSIEIKNLPYHELDLNDFSDHRKKKKIIETNNLGAC